MGRVRREKRRGLADANGAKRRGQKRESAGERWNEPGARVLTAKERRRERRRKDERAKEEDVMKARAQEKTGIRANNPKEKRRKELHQGEGACTTLAHRVWGCRRGDGSSRNKEGGCYGWMYKGRERGW